MGTARSYSREVRERAVLLVLDNQGKHGLQSRNAPQLLPADRRIYAIREQFTGCLVSRPSSVDRYVRVGAER
jgi:hypothetical protein